MYHFFLISVLFSVKSEITVLCTRVYSRAARLFT